MNETLLIDIEFTTGEKITIMAYAIQMVIA